MDKTVVWQDDHVTMWYLPDLKIVHHQFHKPMRGVALRSVMTKGIEALRENQANKWLSDDRENYAVDPEDRKWGEENWLPLALEAGWKFWAIVLPKQIIGQINMRYIAQTHSQRGLQVKFFSNPGQAMEWLVQIPD